MGTIVYACGCAITFEMGGGPPLHIRPCVEHGNFHTVKRALRAMREAIAEAHEQLPPGPKEAA